MSGRVVKTGLLGWLLLLGLWSVAGCQRVAPVIKIGFVAPFEGRHRPVGYDTIYSARLAIREINTAGGVNGSRVELVALDDGGDVQLARQVAQSLVIDPDILIVIGHWRPETSAAAAPIYTAAGLAFIPTGSQPFVSFPALELPADFQNRYRATTPFAEEPGAYAGPAYDSLQLALAALSASPLADRATIQRELAHQQINGLTGPISLSGGPEDE